MNVQMQVYNDFPIAQTLWYKVGGKVKYFLPAESREDLLRALEFVDTNNPNRVFFCGLGANLIFPDGYFDGAVIQIASPKKSTQGISIKAEGLLEAFSGVVLDDAITTALGSNLTGLEWAGGLPGTIGAGVRGNVGAFGGEIKDNFISAEVLDTSVKGFHFSRIKKEDFHFAYRNSIVKEQRNLLVVSALFGLQESDPEAIEKAQVVYKKNITYRKEHHPIEYPNCGSVFKNVAEIKNVEKVIAVWPDAQALIQEKWHGKVSMGYIIKRLGFAGYRIGHMEVSTKHANFIVNMGEGKASDVKIIISHIQEKVSETFGFVPEVEVEIVT